MTLGAVAPVAIVLASRLWPSEDPLERMHQHPDLPAEHSHLAGTTSHGAPNAHSHEFVIDDEYPRWPSRADTTITRIHTYTQAGVTSTINAQVVNPIVPHRATGSSADGWMTAAGLANGTNGRWAKVNVLSYESTAVAGVHIIGDASQCGLPKAGHVANQEAKICADAIVRLMGGSQPDPGPVANSACYSPITASTASWLTAVYQYDAATTSMAVASNGGNTATGASTESATISSDNFQNMNIWFNTLMGDTFA